MRGKFVTFLDDPRAPGVPGVGENQQGSWRVEVTKDRGVLGGRVPLLLLKGVALLHGCADSDAKAKGLRVGGGPWMV